MQIDPDSKIVRFVLSILFTAIFYTLAAFSSNAPNNADNLYFQ
ncbi:hypothetical protein NNJEOMEG_03651 [Fundidesulfovibrio magnetotacticus]|uniref:Uncharacterized protein n=1 Tax=Fundidesulfovibrio magnetotacticus TaxID=2730080 RepID=A0A6V8LTJ5_9BACT|nr:hypothetical protein NNJEOMEG_03651 [Fundidesulfovibrio magnetotacticus]